MKLSLSLLALAVAVSSLTGCNTLVTRRDMYWPAQASGPYTKQYAGARYNEGIYGVSQNIHDPAGPDEGIFGISHSQGRYMQGPGPEEGLFGVSRNVR